jgi:hypothetical protein
LYLPGTRMRTILLYSVACVLFLGNDREFFFVIPFYLQSVLVYSANCVKTCIQRLVEECSVALLCN